MEASFEYLAHAKVIPEVRDLDNFLVSGGFQTPASSAYTNIINQCKTEGHYFVPYNDESININNISFSPNSQNERSSMLKEHIMDMQGTSNKFHTPIDEFFELLEKCRRKGLSMGYCERQYFKLPMKAVGLKPVAENVFSSSEIEDLAENAQDSDPSDNVEQVIQTLTEDVSVDHSCIELDFDIYQNTGNRVIEDATYFMLVYKISELMAGHLDFASMQHPAGVFVNGSQPCVEYHVAIIRKPEVVSVKHEKYGKCWKDSFHIRIFIKQTKAYKKFLISAINSSDTLQGLTAMPLCTPVDQVIDQNCTNYTVMLPGSKKNKGKVPHEFYKLYRVRFTPWPMRSPLVEAQNTFDPILNTGKITKRSPMDGRRNIHIPVHTWPHNICHELSMHFEKSDGVIRKRIVPLFKDIQDQVSKYGDRYSGDLNSLELADVDQQVNELVSKDYRAKYIKRILDILAPERASDFKTWRSIIMILARENRDYKCLAVYFSQRCPHKWHDKGETGLNSIWNWALSNPISDAEGETCSKIEALYAWAKNDDPEKYRESQEFNAFTTLQKLAFDNMGNLNDDDYARVLKIMYGDVFITDENDKSKSSDRRWYEFVFPQVQERDCGLAYKWRYEKSPDTLVRHITETLKDNINTLICWMKSKMEEDKDESACKFYSDVMKNLQKSKQNLGNSRKINDIIKMCAVRFRERGFHENLDKNPDYIGIGNGVLKLQPTTELITQFHNIPISRSTRVHYKPCRIDMNLPEWSTKHENTYIASLFTEIKRLFAGELDAFVYTMCYLSNSLDGRRKNPLFFIWLGGGSNGKSFLLEMHINALHYVVNRGYAAKMNALHFTKEAKNTGGTDSEKMMLQYARFAYCSESQPGDTLQMGKIKEYTSETLSGNEKYQTQDMFEANCHFVFCTNHDPRITGRDWGTWRRILAYVFKMKFVDNPDPDDPRQYRMNTKLINEWVHDENYKRAYFAILVYFYEMYRDLYHGNLSNIPKPTIESDTQNYKDSQDTLERFITQRVLNIGDTYPDGEPVAPIPLNTVANKYTEWHRSKIGGPVGAGTSDLVSYFKETRLRKFIHPGLRTEFYLHRHRILEDTENMEDFISDSSVPDSEPEPVSTPESFEPIDNVVIDDPEWED
jgi:phage/plasmid-associated DNA primase